jgi:hypothetical protein
MAMCALYGQEGTFDCASFVSAHTAAVRSKRGASGAGPGEDLLGGDPREVQEEAGQEGGEGGVEEPARRRDACEQRAMQLDR